jgi:peptidoglycan/xylan/chitin deacetylase (PgdA/CDA1 family)
MRALRLLGYRVISLDELTERLRAHRLPDRRSVVLTIDDGYRDNLEIARPILRRHGFPATLFAVSGTLGHGNLWDRGGELAGRPMLSAVELRELAHDGVAIGGHTRSHPSLPKLGDAALSDELGGARSELERELGRPVNAFSYPFGHHDDAVVCAVRAAGFMSAVTTEPHLVTPADDVLRIPRIEIFGTDSLPRFLRKLRCGGG